MKKMIPILCLIGLLLSGCASRSPAAPIQAARPDPAASVEPAPQESPVPVVIRDAFCEMGSYGDNVGNSWDYVLRIPMIETSGADATRLNQALYSALYPGVKDAKDSMAGGYSLIVNRVDYTVFVNDQLISILCETNTDWGFDSYFAVNFDASTHSEETRTELLQRFGMTEESFCARASDIMEAYFRENFSMVTQDDFYLDRHDKSVNPMNFKEDCQLYVNDQGQLCMIPKLYSFAGADYYYHIFAVT